MKDTKAHKGNTYQVSLTLKDESMNHEGHEGSRREPRIDSLFIYP
jgi:hypothetical protein